MGEINNASNFDDINLYILKSSSIIEQEADKFVVSGEIGSNELVSFSGGKLNLTCYDYSDEHSIGIPCTIAKTSGNKFDLNCEVEDKINCNLDNSMLVDDKKILIVDFEEGTNGNITIDPDDFETNKKNYYKSSGGLSGGIIALIVIIPIALVAIIVTLIYLLKKQPTSNRVINSSNSIDNLNNIK